MRYFPVRYDSRVEIYERKMFIRLATGGTSVERLHPLTEIRGFDLVITTIMK